MKIFAISDLHLSGVTNKPMDVFGDNWAGHWVKIRSVWNRIISPEDVVLLAGDTSWGMTVAEAEPDLRELDALNGKKYLIRGNHDYWWTSLAKLNALSLNTIRFVQNNAFREGDFIICGTRGWSVADGDVTAEDKKIFDREVVRLKLTLDAATKLQSNREEILVMLHYPPFNSRYEDSAFTDLVCTHNVKTAIYGHLHGFRSRYTAAVNKNGTNFILTSCDFLNFVPLQIR